MEFHKEDFFANQQESVLHNKERPFRLTPFIVTFYEEKLTHIDIQRIIEMGLRIVRFRVAKITLKDKIKLLEMIKKALKWVCEKYDVSTWPIAISIDVPNACIKTGHIRDDIESEKLTFEEDAIVEITSDDKYMNKCDEKRVYIDDSYIIRSIKPGNEISFRFGAVVMICTEKIDTKTIKCKVVRGETITTPEYVCVRGIKHEKPPLTKHDRQIIQFAKDFGLDIVTVNAVRCASTLKKVRAMFDGDSMPLIMSTICEQEGLDNIDSIINESDGIILAREFLASEIINKHKMIAIQLQVNSKCKKLGKPFYISGNILEETMLSGTNSISPGDVNDITNAVQNGAGFVLRNYNDPTNLFKTMFILDSICRYVEPLARENDFWRMSNEKLGFDSSKVCCIFKMPVNAAEACILACALTAKQTGALVVVLPTVTGRTAVQLAHMAPQAVILTISSNPVVARRLQLHRGIIPIIYDKKPHKDWYVEMEARIEFAVLYAIKHNLLTYGHTYVALKKSTSMSSFCDSISVWNVVIKASTKRDKCQSVTTDYAYVL